MVGGARQWRSSCCKLSMQLPKRQEKVKYGFDCDEEDKEGLWVFTLMRLWAWSATQGVDKMDGSDGGVSISRWNDNE